MRVLVTGNAGFIGFHVARRLLASGHTVAGLDAMLPYYDVTLKRRRIELLAAHPGFTHHEQRLENLPELSRIVADAQPELVVHLAAQAGVRHSIDHPEDYVQSNLVGTVNLLETMRAHLPRHLLIASSSSVYGGSAKTPLREIDATDTPLNLYAASKKATEVISHSYAHLWNIPTTCFRFFTVYGPWGRPDMAAYKFAEAMRAGKPIDVFGEGKHLRDFTYIDDLVNAIERLAGVVPARGAPVGDHDTLSVVAPWRVVNIGGGRPVPLMQFIGAIEAAMGITAQKKMLPLQAGDVLATEADTSLLQSLIGFVPETPIDSGIASFIDWYRNWTGNP